MRVGLAQINSTLGDFAGNRRKIMDNAKRAADASCDLVVFPELALFGYLPGDLLERHSVVERQLAEFHKLASEFPKGIAGLIGVVSLAERTKNNHGKPFHNAAALLQTGKKPRFFFKELLPTYDVFDENRFMAPGHLADNHFQLKGCRVQVTICEDIWAWEISGRASHYLENPLLALAKTKTRAKSKTPIAGPDLIVNLSASPFTNEKEKLRRAVVTNTARLFCAPVIYVNMVGGQDELVFDGGSLVVAPDGREIARLPRFIEHFATVDFASDARPSKRAPSLHTKPVPSLLAKRLEKTEATRQALVLGMRDYARKTGFARVHLGLSGGIDSAVVACLAAEALGPDNVTGIAMPGPYSAAESLQLAQESAHILGLRFLQAPINATYDVALEALAAAYGNFDFGLTNENLQSRLRALFLMAYSNKQNSLLLATGNKCEYAVGYATLYGDMCGGLAPIGDLVKQEVYDLASLFNRTGEIIPARIIERAPTAELAIGQTDQDYLPPYPELDRAVRALVEFQRPARTATEKWLLPRLIKSEFKRWQAAPILKVTRHAFGRGRRLPIAHGAGQ